MDTSNTTSITLPPALECGENPKVIASLYDLDTDQTVAMMDTSAVLTARRVRGTTTTSGGNYADSEETEINIIDFSATTLQQQQLQQNVKNNDDENNNLESTTTKNEDNNAKLAKKILSEMGGRAVCFDKVHSGQARTTEIVESLLPYALSTGTSSNTNSILFVNNFGASESPFQQPCRGETSIVYQILANMHPWVRRRSCEMEATLIAWDAWGDAVDLFSSSSSSTSTSMNNNNHSSSSYATTTLNHLMTDPLKFTGMNRMFDDLCVTKVIQNNTEGAFHHQRNNNQNNNSNSNNTNNSEKSSRFKTVADLCDTVDKKVSAFRRQIVTTAFSKDASALSNSNDYRYAVCLRLDLVPNGVDSNDELSWGSLSIVECSGSMLCQARSSRRGISPSLLSCVKALALPAEEPPIKLSASSSSSSTTSPLLLYPLQSLSDLPNRPELSLACCLMSPSCSAQMAIVLPVPKLCYGSSALFVQASVDALCLIARREWVTYPESPPEKSCESALHLFASSYERKHREVTQLRWILKQHRNCKMHEQIEKLEEEDEQRMRDYSSSSRMHHHDTKSKNNRDEGTAMTKNSLITLNSEQQETEGGTTTIPAIDAWIIAMRRRLASLEEVEADQHKWHAWLEDYREWLLSLPASGPTTSTATTTKDNNHPQNTKENHNHREKVTTLNWAERCELLERVVAQQQEEMKRIKRICLRDVENLRDEVALLRSAKEKNKNNNNTTTDENNNTTTLMTTQNFSSSSSSTVMSQSEPTLRELRSLLQGFEFDVIGLKNNATSSALPPEEVRFELSGMIDRLKRDVESVVRPWIDISHAQALKQMYHQQNINDGNNSSSSPSNVNNKNKNKSKIFFEQSLPWSQPKRQPDQQALYRRERLRLRALAGALARGCDDLASRIRSAIEVDKMFFSSPVTTASSSAENDKNKNNLTLRRTSSFANNQNNNNTNPNDVLAASGIDTSPAINPIKMIINEHRRGGSSTARRMSTTTSSSNNNDDELSQSNPLLQDGRNFHVNPLAVKKYGGASSSTSSSSSVLSITHEQWCREVAFSLRNSAENIANELDTEMKSSGNEQDGALAELCARFFANRATAAVNTPMIRSGGVNDAHQQSSSSSLSKILAHYQDHHQQQQQQKRQQTPTARGRDVIPRVGAVSLQSITGNNNKLGLAGSFSGAGGGGGEGSLRSQKFKKGLFSDPTTPNERNRTRSSTPGTGGGRRR